MFWHKRGYCLLRLESQIIVSRLEKYQNHQLSLLTSYIVQATSTCFSFFMDFGQHKQFCYCNPKISKLLISIRYIHTQATKQNQAN